MKLGLAGKPKAPSRLQDGIRRPSNPFHTRKAGAKSRRPFFFQPFRRLTGRWEEKAIDSLEVTGKTFSHDDSFDPIDRRGMALGSQTGAFFAMKPLDCHIAVVNRV
jgi:hypothetical protein